MYQLDGTPGDHTHACPVEHDDSYVRVDVLRYSFYDTVRSLGGDPVQLMSAVKIDPAVLQQPGGKLSYRAMIDLFEYAAHALRCPDFGLRLARQTKNALAVLGPLETPMRNARTLGEAYDYCTSHVNVYSTAIHASRERDQWNGRDYLLVDVLLNGVEHPRQVIEHAIGLSYIAFLSLCDAKILPTEVWFTHSAPKSCASHAEFFGTSVKFNMPYNAIYLGCGVLNRPIENRNAQVFQTADGLINEQFPAMASSVSRQVRVVLAKLRLGESCSQVLVADMLGMHSRTLQRRLRAEGKTFEEIVDAARREIALRNLTDEQVSLTQITEKLGYSESSVLTRSCQRWFSRSPRQIRKAAQPTILSRLSAMSLPDRQTANCYPQSVGKLSAA
ncbi:AraC family transcriptional regulator [Massilia niabensis]|uniref:AraC family transcriptional regulator ligand-binding domain-containing protein n=1 Tax=Massilia niabensis TaxID=544910 RepID=A0ABW0LB61_9BURK